MNFKEDNPWFVKINKVDEPSFTLLCFHYGGGSASIFRDWKKFFSDNIQLIAIQLPGREMRFSETPISSLVQIIDQLSKEIYPYVSQGGKYGIFGHSIGALIGFELTRNISNTVLPQILIVSALDAPQIEVTRQIISNLPDKEFIEKLKLYNGISNTLEYNEDILSTFMPMLRADLAILEGYKYHHTFPLENQILAIGGINDSMILPQNIAAWCMQTNQLFSMRLFPGDHFFIKQYENEVLTYLSGFINQIIKSSS